MKKKRRYRKVKKETDAKTTTILIKSALSLARKTGARALFIYGNIPCHLVGIRREELPFKIVLVTSHPESASRGGGCIDHVLRIPDIPFTRMGQLKVSLIIAVSRDIIDEEDRIIFLGGMPGHNLLDSITVVDVEKEFSLSGAPQMLHFVDKVDRSVFDQVIQLAIEIANEGREGHPVGTIFIFGDTREVLKHVEQMIINPFKGHRKNQRQILNPDVHEVVKELSQLDGAFIIRGDGVFETAGAYIVAKMVPESLPQGLGARHYSAAAITAATNAIAITVSQSTGDVYIFKNGRIVTCIEKHAT